jgi:hypothetical protein
MKKYKASLVKAARLTILAQWEDRELLKDKSPQQIANLFPDHPHPSVIQHDLQELERLRHFS